MVRSPKMIAWIGAGVLLLVVLGWRFHQAHSTAQPVYNGVALGDKPAPNFTLTDAQGKKVSLAQLRGHAVLLTFLDGHCKDVCPLTLGSMADIERRLGQKADEVAIVAVSVDPWLDAVGKPAAIALDHPAPSKWQFLTGTLDQLKPVWDAYHVAVVEDKVGRYGANGAHDTGFFLIDPQGRLSRYIGSDAPVQRITNDLEALLRSSAS